MPWCGQEPKGDKQSTKYRSYSHEGAFFGHADFSVSQKNKKQNNNPTELKPQEIMTKRELISSVGYIWSSAALPLSFILSSECSHRNVDPRGNSLINVFPVWDIHIVPSLSGGGKTLTHLCIDKETGLDENGLNQQLNSELEIGVIAKNQCQSLAKREHAFAGAMAGICVSICLHPMDTIKTIIQSCHADRKSFYYIGRLVISERGIMGLYRGILSNIASSAPISALYTFTYEFVKGALHLLLHTEYQSLAHCIAGGSASVATSFIFTPSERIKQQMQVHSHYKKCWDACICIIKNGGLPSLYVGWGAVLCRNVPHSIIKFYTYETLKQLVSSPVKFDLQNNTVMTLVCGGLSGSMAALFTTPFDVVKTRMQTQVPGSNQYGGVLDSLKKIIKHEGLAGLYRGLTPRLAMYVTQGALFFTSYESFKKLLSLDVRQLAAQRTHQK
ncbi:unnamed protein product [Cuscuta europaea]|uniref:Mitochondrial carrier protein n=1 Tax=Cuscuta europaea TaxID=41803 RepID=A0A9P0ZT59_CUSEU|nr:unnamed protein product [Cuscuta europaea]